LKLTPKQEAFCLAYIETGNASEAYRRSYDAENQKSETTNRNAKALLDNNKIATRLGELQDVHVERHKITVDSLTKELEADRELARRIEQPSPAVTATMSIAKLHGLDITKVEADVNVNAELFDVIAERRKQIAKRSK